MASARELGYFVKSTQGSLRAWGAGYWTSASLGTPIVHDRVFAITNSSLAWGRGPYVGFVEVDFREDLSLDVEQMKDGSWSIALIPARPDLAKTGRYPSLFNFTEVFGGDLRDSHAVVNFLLSKFPRHSA